MEQRSEKIIGYTEREALQLNGWDIFTAEDRTRGVPEREMEAAIQEGQANDERWHVRKDGSLFFAVGRLVALKDEAGTLYGFAKILRDATPHKTLEQALHASDEQFRATFAQAPLAMALTDLQGRIQQTNAAFCQRVYDQTGPIRKADAIDPYSSRLLADFPCALIMSLGVSGVLEVDLSPRRRGQVGYRAGLVGLVFLPPQFHLISEIREWSHDGGNFVPTALCRSTGRNRSPPGRFNRSHNMTIAVIRTGK